MFNFSCLDVVFRPRCYKYFDKPSKTIVNRQVGNKVCGKSESRPDFRIRFRNNRDRNTFRVPFPFSGLGLFSLTAIFDMRFSQTVRIGSLRMPL